MDGSMCWFEGGYCFLPVVAVGGTAIAQGQNLPQCPQMWTLILVSTNVDTILYLYLRLLTLPIIHPTGSSITIDLLSCVSHCFPARFFISFLVCFSVQVATNTYSGLIVIPSHTTCLQQFEQTELHTKYIQHIHRQVSFRCFLFLVMFLCFFLVIRPFCEQVAAGHLQYYCQPNTSTSQSL